MFRLSTYCAGKQVTAIKKLDGSYLQQLREGINRGLRNGPFLAEDAREVRRSPAKLRGHEGQAKPALLDQFSKYGPFSHECLSRHL